MSNPLICSHCVGNDHFSAWISQAGRDGVCQIDPTHVGQEKVIPASLLAEEVDRWFRESYVIGEIETCFYGDSDKPSYDQRGDPYADIMMEGLVCDEDVIHAIEEHLPDSSSRDIAQGADSFYDDSQLYESVASIEAREARQAQDFWYENRIYFQWQDFCEAAKHRRRFFGLKSLLDDLFGDPLEFENGHIRPVYALPAGQKIFRARLLYDASLEDSLYKNPASELGAPPKERTRAGRMNVEFIPTFYAAFDEETAVAEIRPGIGEAVAVGEFETQRSLRVFDFTAFERATGENRQQAIAHTRYEFINEMESEISRPIMPYDKQREYIPTQIIAEYLGECFGCDAVIYRSSMINDSRKESRNIVLLNKGAAFQGGAYSALKFVRFTVKDVRNIQYDLEEHIRF